jgi:hypothetical protein
MPGGLRRKARTLALRADVGNPAPDMTQRGRLEKRYKTAALASDGEPCDD